MDIRVRSAARSWTVCKYMYISEVNIRSLRHPCRECDAWRTYWRCARWSGKVFLSDAADRTIAPDCNLKKHRSSPHPGHPHAQTQPDTSWPRSRAYPRLLAQVSWESHSAGRFSKSSAPTTGQPCWLFGSGWFLDLPYRVVTITQVLDTGDANRARQYVCPAGSPGTAGGFAGVCSCDAAVLWFIFLDIVWCIMQCWAAAQNVYTSPHPAYFLCHGSPASRGFANLSLKVSSSTVFQFLC